MSDVLQSINPAMRQDVIARQVRAIQDAGLDAVVSISPENFAYVTGFLSPTQPLMRWRHAMALVTSDAVALVVVDMEASTIRAKSPPGTEIAGFVIIVMYQHERIQSMYDVIFVPAISVGVL